MELGIEGVENLDIVCEGLHAFFDQFIQNVYDTASSTTIACNKGEYRHANIFARGQNRRTNIFASTVGSEELVLVTVTTSFDDHRSAPLQFGFKEFLEQLIVSEDAQKDLPSFIRQALGDTVGVHITLKDIRGWDVVVIAFGPDAPTGSPTASNTTDIAPPASKAYESQHLVLFAVTLMIGTVMMMS